MKRFIVILIMAVSVNGIVSGQPKKIIKAAAEALTKKGGGVINPSIAVERSLDKLSEIYVGSSINVANEDYLLPNRPQNYEPVSIFTFDKRPLKLERFEMKKFSHPSLKLHEQFLLEHNKQLRSVLVSPSSQFLDRGLVPEKHIVAPVSFPSKNKQTVVDFQNQEKSSSWRNRLREKVHDKMHKINTIESKGNFYMIYGYFLKFNEDGEYCINYAA